MMIIKHKRQGRRGVTLIEAVLFISIALGLIVGGLVFFQQASLAARTNDAVRSISGIASETRAAFRTQANFDGLAANVLISAGAVPTSQISGANIISEWNTVVTVSGSAPGINSAFTNLDGTSAPANRYFVITYQGIPEAACTRLATASDGNGPIGPGIVTVFVRPTGATDDAVINPTTGYELSGRMTITPGDATTLCSTGNDPVDVSWVLAR